MSQNEELRRLKKENRALKKQLHDLQKATHAEPPISEVRDDSFSAGNYFAFLFSRLRQKNFYAPIRKIVGYLRNSLFLTRLFRFGLLLYQYLQAGAFVLIYTAVFLLLIPILLSVAIITLILALLLRSQNEKKLRRELQKQVVFVLPDAKEHFTQENLRAAAADDPEASVLLVTPFFLKRTGLGEKTNWFVCFRKERENVYILRTYFFFYLRRRLQKSGDYTILTRRLGEDTKS